MFKPYSFTTREYENFWVVVSKCFFFLFSAFSILKIGEDDLVKELCFFLQTGDKKPRTDCISFQSFSIFLFFSPFFTALNKFFTGAREEDPTTHPGLSDGFLYCFDGIALVEIGEDSE